MEMKNNKEDIQIPGQIGLFEFLEENYNGMQEKTVKIEGVINVKTLSDFVVRSTYRDIFLIVNMLDDYVEILKNSIGKSDHYTEYMISQFERISHELAEQIELDKEKMYKKCKNRQRDDTGEDAMVLAAKV